ncbi:uncharacterized protein F4822DRAFT_328680 [Hypoxylon trugodes]|uniref:uncharacterized protein n=1 Tax=Hypoxylon trugodes TaxID=326681 RepID=UPI0021928590|nr:uncharacterized protein F4822DRAFT_328680 [Hypoxylon trugodes]KAI1386876.1 hypothetical protein F4822DRAFT_328680 [Hypoxylon trugodes]
MSSETQPINPARFAEALKDLPAESLALKVLELRNSIAHLDYSNAELKPYAEGRAPTLDQQGETTQPDQDCIDAIAENEAVITRMQERIELIRVEVEGRGLSWREFQGKADEETAATDGGNTDSDHLTNGVNGTGASDQTQHPAWQDGTFQTGTISQLGAEERELLRQLQSRMPPEDEDDDPEGGMHL